MTENEVIDFLEDEINGLKEQRDGVLGEIATRVFEEINGKERIATFRMIIGFIIELKQYREIGTVEECGEAVEKQNAKKPIDYDEDLGYFKCPSCGCCIMADEFSDHKYCLNCGQAISWEESEV